MSEFGHPYWLPLYENGPALMVSRVGKLYRIEIRPSRESNDVTWCDTQRIPFWASEKRRGEGLKIFSKLFPALTKESFEKVCMDMASAQSFGDLPTPTETPEEEKITDKQITDTIMAIHQFYCDTSNPNLPLYIWDGVVWSDKKAEATILREVSEILKEEENRAQMAIGRTTDFIKGQSMNVKIERKPPELIPFMNHLYNIKTGEAVPHNSKYFYVNLIPHEHNPAATCDKFLAFLKDVIKPEDLDFMQEWAGYMLYDKTPEAVFLVLIGTTNNGKTVLMIVLSNLLGELNISTISLAALTYDFFERADIENKLAVIGDDIGTDVIKNASALKSISAGSRITVQRKFGQPHSTTPYCKLMWSCNEAPEIKDQSDAIKVRLRVVEFPCTFSKTPNIEKGEKLAKDRDILVAELNAEIPGIINWALEGLKRLIDNNFKLATSRSTEETWEFWRKKATPAICYVDARWDVTGDDEDMVERGTAYKDFQQWITDEKLKIKVSRKDFYSSLKDEGFESPQVGPRGGARCFRGVKLLGAPAPPADEGIKKDIIAALTMFGNLSDAEMQKHLKDADPVAVTCAAEELHKEEKIVKIPVDGMLKWGVIREK
jgi:P4 family phage/plasmid primase-like protien